MSEIGEKEREELELLMPWYVNGTLDPALAERVEAALKTDAALARSFDVLAEDRDAVVASAGQDALPASMEARFLAQLDAEPMPGALQRSTTSSDDSLLSRAGSWLGDFVAAMTPGRLAVAAAVACLVVALQTGVIVSLLGERPGFETASGPADTENGPALLVQFAPAADVAAISAYLDETGARIVDGPLAGGMFKLRFGAAEERNAQDLTALLRGKPELFSLVLPGD